MHAAAQIRWTRADAPARQPLSAEFHEAVDDAQSLHIWQFLFQDKPPPTKHSDAAAVVAKKAARADSGELRKAIAPTV